MSDPGEWYATKGWFFWRVERRLWSNFAGAAYQWHKNRNGLLRRFWTRAEAERRALAFNLVGAER